jgi:hypothetical protein
MANKSVSVVVLGEPCPSLLLDNVYYLHHFDRLSKGHHGIFFRPAAMSNAAASASQKELRPPCQSDFTITLQETPRKLDYQDSSRCLSREP